MWYILSSACTIIVPHFFSTIPHRDHPKASCPSATLTGHPPPRTQGEEYTTPLPYSHVPSLSPLTLSAHSLPLVRHHTHGPSATARPSPASSSPSREEMACLRCSLVASVASSSLRTLRAISHTLSSRVRTRTRSRCRTAARARGPSRRMLPRRVAIWARESSNGLRISTATRIGRTSRTSSWTSNYSARGLEVCECGTEAFCSFSQLQLARHDDDHSRYSCF